MQIKISIACLLFLSIFAVSYSSAQESAQQLIEQGQALIHEQKFDQAEKVLKQALELDKTAWDAIYGLGEIELQRQNWDRAHDYFKVFVKRRPNDLLARYKLAISYRELGKLIDPVRRILFWQRSRKHFQFVISKDILFRDILYQFAILQRYRHHYTATVALTEQQLRLKPDLSEVQIRVYRFYDYLLENSSEANVRSWLSSKNYPRARYFLGELSRRHEKFDQADSILTNLLSNEITFSRQPVFLSLVRLYLQMDKPRKAEEYYRQAVDSIKTNNDADLLFEDIKYIVTDKEFDGFQKLITQFGKQQFFRKFWGTRDPMPAASENVRLIEHYHRMLKAEKHYRYDGFRTWMNNPDKLKYLQFPKAFYLNDKFNDKGMIYIRHGEADENVFTLGQDEGHNESWLYYARGRQPKMMFHFVIAEHAAGNNWRLTPHLQKSWIADRVEWDAIFHRYYHADELDMAALDLEMAQKCKEDVEIGLSTDRHTWPKELEPIEIPFYTAIFLGKNGNNLLEFYYGVPRSYLDKNKLDSNSVAEAGLVIHDRAWNRVFQQIDEINISELDEEDFKNNLYVGQWRASVAPDVYSVAMHFNIKGTLKIGGYRFQQQMIDYGMPQLAISSIELAHSIEQVEEDDPSIKHGLRVFPNPTMTFKRNDPVYLYYEIYNLKKDSDSRTSFTVEHKVALIKPSKRGIFKKALNIFSRSREEVSSMTEREGRDETSIEHLALDLSSARAGHYRLTVTVQDRNSGERSETSTEFNLK